MSVSAKTFNGVLYYNGAELIGTFDGVRVTHFWKNFSCPSPSAEFASTIIDDMETQHAAEKIRLSGVAKKAVATRATNIAALTMPAAPTADIVAAPDAATAERIKSGARRSA